MAIRQLTVFVENKQGKLVEITRLLAEAGIDMRALSIADTKDFGILRLIVSDTDKALLELAEHGVMVKITEVAAVELPHRPGSLSEIISKFAAIGVNLTKLESRPLPGMDFEFRFTFEFEATPCDPAVLGLLSELSLDPEVEHFTFLGAYAEK